MYDPSLISYGELLDVFWSSHNPATPGHSEQYKSVIFYHTDAQRKAAEASRAHREELSGGKLYTEISPAPTFWLAEDYHQKYMLRRFGPIASEYERIYPNPEDFRDSTAVARTNGYVGGYGTRAELDTILPMLGLSPEAQTKLRALTKGR